MLLLGLVLLLALEVLALLELEVFALLELEVFGLLELELLLLGLLELELLLVLFGLLELLLFALGLLGLLLLVLGLLVFPLFFVLSVLIILHLRKNRFECTKPDVYIIAQNAKIVNKRKLLQWGIIRRKRRSDGRDKVSEMRYNIQG